MLVEVYICELAAIVHQRQQSFLPVPRYALPKVHLYWRMSDGPPRREQAGFGTPILENTAAQRCGDGGDCAPGTPLNVRCSGSVIITPHSFQYDTDLATR